MTISSDRDERFKSLHPNFGRTSVADLFRGAARRPANRRPASAWVAIVYVVVALATPLLVYAGPSVISPAACVIAEAALDGHFALGSASDRCPLTATGARSAAADQTSTRSMPPRFALATYSAIQFAPSTWRAISTTM